MCLGVYVCVSVCVRESIEYIPVCECVCISIH